MGSRAEMLAAAKAAQGVVQAAPTVQAALAPPPPPPPAPAPAAPVAAGTAPRREEPRRVPKPQGGGAPRRETPPPPAVSEAPKLTTAAAPPWQPPVTAFHGVLTPESYINPEEAMRRVDELRMRRLARASRAERMARRDVFPGLEEFTPREAAPESALTSVQGYETELSRRARQYQQISGMLAALGTARRELEQDRVREGTAPRLRTVQRPLTATEQQLEQTRSAVEGFNQDLQRARAALLEMGLTEEQIKLYD